MQLSLGGLQQPDGGLQLRLGGLRVLRLALLVALQLCLRVQLRLGGEQLGLGVRLLSAAAAAAGQQPWCLAVATARRW